MGPAADFVPEWQFTTVNADQRWASANRDVVIRFFRALQRGRDFMDQDPSESARIAAKELQTTVELAQRALGDATKMQILHPRLEITGPGIRKVFETLQLSGDIDARQTFDLGRFADMQYLEASRSP